MNVMRNAQGNVVVELETDEEVVALWAVSAKVSGSLAGPRRHFSNHAPTAPGLFQQLTPFVQSLASLRNHYEEHEGRHSPSSQDVVADLYHKLLFGQLAFLPSPSDAEGTLAMYQHPASDDPMPAVV